MDNINYINISKEAIDSNINFLKNKLKYDYYILDVSNNAFNHGMFIVNFINVDYLYVNSLKDVYNIRKYNKDVPIILDFKTNEDNILDIINNNIIVVINDYNDILNINSFDLFGDLDIIINIDVNNNFGISNKDEIKDIINIVNKNKHLNLLGIKALVDNDKFKDFSCIINPLLRLDMKLFILNNENNHNKIKYSNAILLNKSIYGINNVKNTFFKKEEKKLKQVFNLYSKIIKIKKVSKGKKVKFYGVIPFGYRNGLLESINKVYIKDKLYLLDKIYEDYSLVLIDENINVDDSVEILGINNPLDHYITANTLIYFSILSNNLPILYDNNESQNVYC